MRKTTWWHARCSPLRQVGCGTGKASSGPWWMSMAQNRLPDNEPFPRQQTFLLLIAALIWLLLPDTWDANGEKSCAREPPCSKRILISGWAVSAMQAMAITGENCCGRER